MEYTLTNPLVITSIAFLDEISKMADTKYPVPAPCLPIFRRVAKAVSQRKCCYDTQDPEGKLKSFLYDVLSKAAAECDCANCLSTQFTIINFLWFTEGKKHNKELLLSYLICISDYLQQEENAPKN